MRSPSARNPVESAGFSPALRVASVRGRHPRRRLTRLWQMSLMEIAIRGRQEARKLFERFGLPADYGDPATVLRHRAPALANPAAALNVLREAIPRRFFEGLADPQMCHVIERRMPDHCEAI